MIRRRGGSCGVDPIFFNSQYDPVGVFRHELGHVLGYRHEHIRGIPGCGFEDSRWQPLTPYDLAFRSCITSAAGAARSGSRYRRSTSPDIVRSMGGPGPQPWRP